MKTIYNTYIPLKSKLQLQKLIELCKENGLPVSENNDFAKGDQFRKGIGFGFGNFYSGKRYTQVTESEWLELLKTTK